MPDFLLADKLLTVPGLASFLACLLIVHTKGWHGRFTNDHAEGVQKFHTELTPRIGGVGIYIGLLVAISIMANENAPLLKLILVATIPAFIFGLYEDLFRNVTAKVRLLACLLSGIFVPLLTGMVIDRVGVPIFDQLINIPLIGLIFTAFAVGGMANAINIMDGFHGLASGVVLIGLGAVYMIAYQEGDIVVAQITLVVFFTVLGFFLVNFPFGNIFLGDCGAYLLGVLLACLVIALVSRNSIINPWSAFLICALPAIEVAFTIIRRLVGGRSVDEPDRYHLHSLVYRWLGRYKVCRQSPVVQNATVSPIIWCMSIIPVSLAVITYKNELLALMAAFFSIFSYILAYYFFSSRVCSFQHDLK